MIHLPKSEKFIPKLIDSVIGQTFADWELICVNDCSPQNDLAILQQYAEKDSRIKIVDNKVNLGISKAKFEGIKQAHGKYLMFIDGDDWLESQALERCLEPAEKFSIDMVVMSSQKVLHKGITWKRKRTINDDANRVIEQPELFDKYYINFFGVNLFQVTYWGKLIRRDAFDRANLSPSNIDYSEDLIFNMMLFPHLRSMYMLDYVGYNWRWGGITSGRIKNSTKKTIKLLSFVLDFYQQRLQLIRNYNYDKAYRTLTIELVNYLIFNLSQIAYAKSCDEKLLGIIENYTKVVTRNKNYLEGCIGAKFDVVLSGNPDEIYNFCHTQYRKSYIKNTIKRVVHEFVFR